MKQIRALFSQDVSAKVSSRGQRFWLASFDITSKAKIKVGDRLQPIYNAAKKEIRLVKSKTGSLVVGENRGKPCIDVRNKKVLETFGENISRLFIILFQGEVLVRLTQKAQLIWERNQKIARRLMAKQPFRLGEVCHGNGGLAYAMHTGMVKVGHGLKLVFANDLNAKAIEASAKNNPVHDEDTISLNCCISEIPESLYEEEIDFYVAGLSCKGASKQSRSNGKVSVPEFHDEAGWLVTPVFEHLRRWNPIAAIFENVTGWMNTVSAHLLKKYAEKLGYRAKEITMQAQDFGCIEARQRSALVLVSEGIDFEAEQLDKHKGAQPPVLSTVLQPNHELPPVPSALDVPISKRNGWYPKARLLEREQEAKSKGRGHRAVILDPSTTKVPTLVSSMGKGVRLDGATIESECGLWVRNPTPKEHARIKGLPEDLTEAFSNADAHSMLGNSVTRLCWEALSEEVLSSVVTHAKTVSVTASGNCSCCSSNNVAVGLVDLDHEFWQKAVAATNHALKGTDEYICCRDCGQVEIQSAALETESVHSYILRSGHKQNVAA